ncbi:ATP-binding protein [Campylobacter concisus]|uniref:ATP-binding protein n=1 Tax=Campylobacter concisus TaxID=199 RepID=UPI000CD953D2|nr:ATP-binding protein [Campylobacter concisus]
MPNLTIYQPDDLLHSLNVADEIVNKKYLANLNNYKIISPAKHIMEAKLNKISRLYKLKQFVFDKSEDTRDKLVSVFQAVASTEASLVVIIDSNKNNINYYIGVKDFKKEDPGVSMDLLYKSLVGNFPGVVFDEYKKKKEVAIPLDNTALEELQKDIFDRGDHSNQDKAISVVTGVAGLRAEKSSEQKFIQGLDRVIDAMQGEKYTLMIIADPISSNNLLDLQRNYENLYSAIKPFETTDLTFGENESRSVTQSYSQSISKAINTSITNTLSTANTTSASNSETSGSNISGAGIGAALGAGIGALVGGPVGAGIGMGLGGAIGGSYSINESTTSSTSESHSTTQSEAKTRGETHTVSGTKGFSDSETKGSSKSVQIKFENKAISEILKKIDLQLERLQAANDVGMWNVAAYAIADNEIDSKTVAASYQSIIRGENSGIESSSITTWRDENLINAKEYLRKLCHPLINFEGKEVQSSSLVTSKELAIHAGFPERSVAGFGVKNLASFGREVISETEGGKSIKLGQIYHMGKSYESPVNLDLNSLSGHAFITGSTGSGKSNTIYKIINEAREKNVKFLVIEPAKGEYKHVFGNDKDVSVYGTNPNLTALLRINPFKFTSEIHILEHLDRLVEIFNVCWPMYAAMPAVLKKAIEKSYENAGWDLAVSKNNIDERLFPNFVDVMQNVVEIVNSSEYSDENKGNYKGALVTRLESLTNGLNGLIFSSDDISDDKLFDENAIVDLSRVGSMETKALIMGILVMKLSEYRIAKGDINSELKHICVLEEAHNLLKRTSTEQSSESSNLLGKSVEMLANSIAEMRTYGQGFIIADQSPGLLDMSVIRNTNTKIIMRTPDFNDRELIGKAAGLTDEQIADIVKFPKGVAAIYQNDWIEAVLCKVDKFEANETKFQKSESLKCSSAIDNELKNELIKALLSNFVDNSAEFDLSHLWDKVLTSPLRSNIKAMILILAKENKPPKDLKGVRTIITELFKNASEVVKEAAYEVKDISNLSETIATNLRIGSELEAYQTLILQCVINEIGLRNRELNDLPYVWNEFIRKGGL